MKIPFRPCERKSGGAGYIPCHLAALLSLFVILSLSFAACGQNPPGKRPTPSSRITEKAVTALLPTGTPTASPTPLPPLAILLASQDSDPVIYKEIGATLAQLAANAGFRLEVRQSLSTSDLTEEVRIIVALSPVRDLEALASAAPKVQFLAIGVSNIKPAPNLSILGSEGNQAVQSAFLAGVIAAMITDDWRVAAISLSDTPEGIAARDAFMNGVVFFCGLCRQIYPPYTKYPIYIEYPAKSSPAEKASAASALKEHSVSTAYLYPGASDDGLLKGLGEAKINVIGGKTPAETLRGNWIATIQPDPVSSFKSIWPELIQGKGGINLPIPLVISDASTELFSPGRQLLAQKYLDELISGVIEYVPVK